MNCGKQQALKIITVRKWPTMSLGKLNTYHSATSKQKHIQVTSWLASDKILSSIIIK